ncbi:MAG TPA: Gfo/Idh/MocA family oxidoreductase, partial [Pirellulales bacterium]
MRPDLKKLSRRSFLEESMLAAVAASAAGSLAGQVLAEDAPASNSPSEKLSVAVIGVNGRGQTHIDAFINAKNGTEITYICDADKAVGEKRCQAIAEKTGKKPKFAQDMREVFDDESVDIVSTATPNHWHALTAIWAMQAGKDVYVEKPVSHNVSEGRRMVEAARKYNKICQTGTQCRSTKANHEALKYIRDGKIGEVKLARALCYKGRGPIGKRGEYQPPAEVDYNLWTGPAPMVVLTRPKLHYDWHWVWPTGNGDLGNQGIHQMDVARWMLGVDDLGKSVYSFGGRVGYTDAGDTANTQVCVHEFDGDKAIIFEVRGLKTQP